MSHTLPAPLSPLAEDGQRFNRCLLAQGLWGDAVHEFLHEYTNRNYQVPALEELETEVEVVDVTTEKNGKQWVRKAICGANDNP